MSDLDLFRSLNAGLRIQVSDLTGHANVLTAKVAALEAENARMAFASRAVLDWYDRDGSVGGACDPMEDLRAALKPSKP